MSLLFRIAVYLPVLFMIAVVVVGQQHATAKETLRAAATRTVRWTLWTLILVALMTVADVFVIGW
ncbi:MAG TPA: hypothetical protein EYP98_16145 [Planctomycetes bacterium]|jgi:uncharacterized BrkB/YihY/UPF0761 family membrane protein|nr:hypothetical protein [Planctomycetota bacterium]